MGTGEHFVLFWSKYPRKEGKKRALKVYEKLLRDGVDPAAIATALEVYLMLLAKERREVKYTKHAETFLRNYEDYLEDLTPTPPENSNASLARRVLSGQL